MELPRLEPDSHARVAEQAIAAFEASFGLRVTVHDLRDTLWPYLAPDRFLHALSLCQAIKAMGAQPRCFHWEITRLRAEIHDLPHGRIQVCHAGLVEWMVPVFDSGLRWVFFAGVRRPGLDLVATFDDHVPLPRELAAAAGQPPLVGRAEAERILEHLRQLAARLQLWHRDLPLPGGPGASGAADGVVRSGPRPNAASVAQRRVTINRFVVERHRGPVSLGNLARHLNLTPSRTSHTVRESCGRSFQELITQARLRSACGLLLHSGLAIREVALLCGFESVRHFHRVFLQELGTTPLRYRRSRGVIPAAGPES